jgi:hypothetical protein
MPLVFLNSALLVAAVAAVVPIVLHFLHRKQAREDYLPTLRFLKEGFAANRRRFKLKNLLVLVLRMLAILLLVATLARPAYMGNFFSRKGTAPVAAVMVIDNSVSMAYERAGKTRLDRAKAAIKQAVATLPAGSRVGLVVTGLGPRGETLDRGFSFKADAVSDAVDDLSVSAYGGDCIRALARAYAMIEENKGDAIGTGREVYVASDLAAHAWSAPEALKAPPDTETILLDCDSEENENFYVEAVTAEPSSSPAPHVSIAATVGAGALAADRLIEVSLGGTKRAERLVKVPAGARRTEGFDVATLDAGDGPLQGRVALANDDPVRADNGRYFTVPQNKGLHCLIIRSAAADAAGGAFFLGNALEPKALAGSTGVTVDYANADGVRPDALVAADVIALVGVSDVGDELWKAIDEATTAGKGVVIFLGKGAKAKSYDAYLKAHFGVTVGATQSVAADQSKRLDIVSLDHPMLAAFAGGRNGNLAATRVLTWVKLVNASGAPTATELMRVDGGDAAVMAASVGKGRVVLAAFAPVPEETDLPLRAPFVPFVNELVKYAAGERAEGAPQAVNFEVGGAISIPVPMAPTEREAELMTPLEARPTKIAIAPGTTAFAYRVFFPGNYRVRLPGKKGPVETGFSVNIPAEESRLDRATPEALAAAVPGAIIAKDLSGTPLKRAWGKTRGARELFDLFLALTVILLAIEEFVANRVYSGIAAVEREK